MIEWKNRFSREILDTHKGEGTHFAVKDGVEVAEVYQDVYRLDPKTGRRMGSKAPWVVVLIAGGVRTKIGEFASSSAGQEAVEKALA